MHSVDSWTPTRDCHTYKSAPYSLSFSFPLLPAFVSSSYPHHILISYPLSFLPSSSPPLLLPYLHPPLPHSPLQRWSLGSLVNGPLINEVISWALPLQPLVFAVHGAPSLRPIIIVHRVQEVQTAATRLLKHSKWKYVILPNPNMHTHQTHSIHGLVHTLPPSLHSTQSLICERLTITTTASTFWKNRSFAEHVLQEISSNCVDIKPIDIVSGDRGQHRVSLCAKTLVMGGGQQTRL